MPKVAIKKIHPEAKIPCYMSELAAGADLSAALDESLVIPAGGVAAVPCGFCMELPAGYEGQVRPRSGLALKQHLTVPNAPGTIDADYRGEVKVLLHNFGSEAFTVTNGMRIAQLVVAPVVQADFVVQEELSDTARGAGGFGSTKI